MEAYLKTKMKWKNVEYNEGRANPNKHENNIFAVLQVLTHRLGL